MTKVYVKSKHDDAKLEQIIHELDAYYLRIILYGVARGWDFDETMDMVLQTIEFKKEYQNEKQKAQAA